MTNRCPFNHKALAEAEEFHGIEKTPFASVLKVLERHDFNVANAKKDPEWEGFDGRMIHYAGLNLIIKDFSFKELDEMFKSDSAKRKQARANNGVCWNIEKEFEENRYHLNEVLASATNSHL